MPSISIITDSTRPLHLKEKKNCEYQYPESSENPLQLRQVRKLGEPESYFPFISWLFFSFSYFFFYLNNIARRLEAGGTSTYRGDGSETGF